MNVQGIINLLAAVIFSLIMEYIIFYHMQIDWLGTADSLKAGGRWEMGEFLKF